jgi:CheY-like chemotaxis protein
LLTNAVKYTDANGQILVTAQREGNQAVLRVKDTGIGIATDALPHIFDLFVQADQAGKRSQGGLGIGLTLVRNLVEMHQGTIEARSDGLGKGSEFVVRLPVATQEPSETSDAAPTDKLRTATATAHRLLVVDDNKDAANSLAALLRLQGHEVRVAHNGLSGLEIAKTYRPEMIFLDIGMPEMDGYEVARRLRNDQDLKNIVLAALTGWGQQADRQRTAEAGFDHHLVKPADSKIVESLVADLHLRGLAPGK